MTVEHVGLTDYVAIAAEVTGIDVATLLRFPRLGLADSALHAPAAGFGDTEFYPDFVDKAAVLIVHLAKNHPLPDGNADVYAPLAAHVVVGLGDTPQRAAKSVAAAIASPRG